MAAGEVRALTFRQPWADLVLEGRKDIEIRTWKTTFRGPLVVHAGKTTDSADARRLNVSNYTTGAFLGVSTLKEIIELDEDLWEEMRERHLTAGSLPTGGAFGWVLADPYRFSTPIMGNGRLGLFSPPEPLTRICEDYMAK